MRKPPPEMDHAIFFINQMKPSYSLIAGRPYEDRYGPEIYSLELDCTCLYPARHADRHVPARFYAKRHFWDEWKMMRQSLEITKSVGVLTMNKRAAHFTGWLPFDMLAPVAGMVEARMYTHLLLYGPPLYRGECLPRDLTFERDIVLSDYF